MQPTRLYRFRDACCVVFADRQRNAWPSPPTGPKGFGRERMRRGGAREADVELALLSAGDESMEVLLLGIDHFLDMARSATNVIGNSVATAAVSRWEGQLRPEGEIPEDLAHAIEPEPHVIHRQAGDEG